jgi:hypothetical protein
MKEVMEMIHVSETTMKRLTNVETGVFAVITASGYRSKGSRKMIRRQELEWYLQGGADAVRKNREAESSGTSSTATLLPEMKVKKRRGGRKRKPIRP